MVFDCCPECGSGDLLTVQDYAYETLNVECAICGAVFEEREIIHCTDDRDYDVRVQKEDE